MKQFGLGFNIEAMNRLVERVIDFAVGFAYTRKGDFRSRNARCSRAAKLAFGDDIHSGAKSCEGFQNGLIGIGLHRVANKGIYTGKSTCEDFVVSFKLGCRIAIERRFHGSGDRADIDVLNMQKLVAIRKCRHYKP